MIDIAFSGDPRAVLERARAAAEKYGAKLTGDHVAGTFAGNGIEGNYKFGETSVAVTIENKPDFMPMALVEGAFRKFFESAPAPAGAPAETKQQRRTRADAIIRKHVVIASGAGLIPIPLADIAAVTGVQVSMLGDLTKLYGAPLTQAALQNFVTALTGGMVARLGASAFKAIPGLGTLLGGASMSIMSGASTYAVGHVARNHLETTGNLADVDMTKAKREYADAVKDGKDYVSKLEDDKDKPRE